MMPFQHGTASGAGRTIDRVLRIEEHGVAGPVPMARMLASRETVQADSPPIAAGQMELRAQVTLTAVLK